MYFSVDAEKSVIWASNNIFNPEVVTRLINLINTIESLLVATKMFNVGKKNSRFRSHLIPSTPLTAATRVKGSQLALV